MLNIVKIRRNTLVLLGFVFTKTITLPQLKQQNITDMKRIITFFASMFIALGVMAQSTSKVNPQTKQVITNLINNSDARLLPETMSKAFTMFLPMMFGGDTVQTYNLKPEFDRLGKKMMLDMYLANDSTYIVFADSFSVADMNKIMTFYNTPHAKKYMKEISETDLFSMIAKGQQLDDLKEGKNPGDNRWKTLSMAELQKIATFQKTALYKKFDNTTTASLRPLANQMKTAKEDPNSQLKKEMVKMMNSIGEYLNAKGCKIDYKNDKRFKVED